MGDGRENDRAKALPLSAFPGIYGGTGQGAMQSCCGGEVLELNTVCVLVIKPGTANGDALWAVSRAARYGSHGAERWEGCMRSSPGEEQLWQGAYEESTMEEWRQQDEEKEASLTGGRTPSCARRSTAATSWTLTGEWGNGSRTRG
ncbi:hypothetical protein K505DRAFT_46172 [Melanomma pulvis-pyrius CBS 109.77]|uniref:Uncharacterized protein n=1 Tax=Melanomma pulvis-pyrius CBS 109.77 TaxID=1314802 RepID=A0A6A6X959_9PLEO|nr:hypothetical protein K505DRAFT_46172 [Melanomma pulvis-pyrius CBS 109.77]